MPRSVGIALVGLAAFLGSAAVGLGIQLREPSIHDEFSYLLAADTFLHGRLANPPDPLWHHFETIHVLQQPTYASKYPPAQGLALAAGRAVFGHPLAGVWLTSALYCMAITWMLLAWFPARWAWAGGAIVLAGTSIAGYWAQSYWGGAVAATGGALVWGAGRRLADGAVAPLRDGAWLGLGAAILALSRPLEGALSVLPIAAVLSVRAAGALRGRAFPMLRVGLPALLILASALGWQALLNQRVTGDPLRMPYAAHAAEYLRVPLLGFGTLGPEPQYRHARLRSFHAGWERGWYDAQYTVRGVGWRLGALWKFYLGVAGTIALLGLPAALRDPWTRLALAGVVLLLTTTLFVTTFGGRPHYLAPIAGPLLALQVAGLRSVRPWRCGGRRVGAALAVAFWVALGLGLVGRLRDHPRPESHWSRRRAALIRELVAQPGRDLVIVRYDDGHRGHEEWVYNGAELEGEEVIFARAMDDARDSELISAFPERRVWLLRVAPQGRPPDLTGHPLAPEARRGRATEVP